MLDRKVPEKTKSRFIHSKSARYGYIPRRMSVALLSVFSTRACQYDLRWFVAGVDAKTPA